jgi:hypothetical protein
MMTEVVIIEDGALVATSIECGSEQTVTAPPLPGLGVPPGRRPREEADLLRKWMLSDGVVLRHAEGACVSPVAGGAALESMRSELRVAERATRGDGDTLSRTKVRRRAAATEPVDAAADIAANGPPVTRVRNLPPT